MSDTRLVCSVCGTHVLLDYSGQIGMSCGTCDSPELVPLDTEPLLFPYVHPGTPLPAVSS